jgi:amino acid permease
MVKSQIGLGALAMPVAFDALGMIPGVILLLTIGGITLWGDYMVGVFKNRHRDVYGIDDAGFKMFGPVGREVLAATFCICEISYLLFDREAR